jgi:hypothetical protein
MLLNSSIHIIRYTLCNSTWMYVHCQTSYCNNNKNNTFNNKNMVRLLRIKRHPLTQYFSRQNLICASSIISYFLRVTWINAQRRGVILQWPCTTHPAAFMQGSNLHRSGTYKFQQTSCPQHLKFSQRDFKLLSGFPWPIISKSYVPRKNAC